MDNDPLPRTYFATTDWALSAADVQSIVALSVLLLVLLLCSALISGAEVAFFSLTKQQITKFRESQNNKFRKVAEISDKPKTLLATILVANNFVNIAIVLISYYIFKLILPPYLPQWQFFFFQTIVATVLLVIFGEVIPKVYATQKAQEMALFMATPIQLLQIVFKPINWLLLALTNIIDKRLTQKGHQVSIEEINQAIELTYDVADQQEEKNIIKGVVNFGNTAVAQIMQPRFSVEAASDELNFEQLMERVREAGYSRLPVYHETLDQVIGVLYVKDLIAHQNQSASFDWLKILRPAFFVPEQKKIDDLLKEFQIKRTHIAIVVDEYGGVLGIATLEDVLEEIVGDIFDEFDQKENQFQKINDNTFLVNATLPLQDLTKILALSPDFFDNISGEAETTGGLLLEINGLIPKKGWQFTLQNLTFVVEAATSRKIEKIKIVLSETP